MPGRFLASFLSVCSQSAQHWIDSNAVYEYNNVWEMEITRGVGVQPPPPKFTPTDSHF